MLAMGIGCKRDRHSAVGLFHKAFQLARARGEISAKVPVSLALILLRATIAFENIFDLRPQEELEEAISRAAKDATARDRKGKTLSVGDRVRSRWMGGTRWWNGRIAAVLTASSVDVQYVVFEREILLKYRRNINIRNTHTDTMMVISRRM